MVEIDNIASQFNNEIYTFVNDKKKVSNISSKVEVMKIFPQNLAVDLIQYRSFD